MQVSVETTKGLERKMTVEIPAEQVENEVSTRLKDLATKVKLDGFRKGKVPANVVKQRYGQQVRNEVIGDLMKSTLYEAIQEQHLHVAGIPSIEPTKMDAGEAVQYVATFEVLPEIEITSLDGANVDRIEASVADKDVADTLEKLRGQQTEWVEVDRKAKSGDQVTIDFTGSIDGEEFAGGKAEGFALELGTNSMIPGFEEQLIGSAKDQDTEVKVTFPEDYHHKDVAGKEAVFAIKVHKVCEPKLPELDDAFAEKFNVKEGGIDALRKDLQVNMERELEVQVNNRNKEAVFDKFLELNQFDIPTALIDDEINRLQQQMAQRIAGGNQQIDMSKLPEMPRDLFEEKAKKRVSLGLLITQFVEKNELKVDDERIEKHLQHMASAYEKPEELITWIRGNQQQMAEVEAVVLEEMVVERLFEQAKVSDKTMSYDEVMNPAPATEKE